MKLDNDTIAMLDYNHNISERPQDYMEYDMCNEDQFIFDEEWDYMNYTVYLPKADKNYLHWFQDKKSELEGISTEDETLILEVMENLLINSISNPKSFHSNIWSECTKRVNDLINN